MRFFSAAAKRHFFNRAQLSEVRTDRDVRNPPIAVIYRNWQSQGDARFDRPCASDAVLAWPSK